MSKTRCCAEVRELTYASATNDTAKQVHEPSRELTGDELGVVSGGYIFRLTHDKREAANG